jgi:indolepyruvate ferredoxin oxidoreductase beta subunit
MRALNMLFAGVGGQGILFASKIFFEAAMRRGEKVMGAETHGMSQRGGSVVSHFKMGDQSSAMVIPGTADVLVGLERTEGLRNIEFLRDGGIYLVNAPDLSSIPESTTKQLSKQGIRVHNFDADGIAMAKKKPLTANLYLIGYLCSQPEIPFEHEEIKETVGVLTKPAFLADNLEALEFGFEKGKAQQ